MNLLRLPPPRSAVCGGKWLALAASIYIQCISGSSYCFGVYSSLFKNSLDSVACFKEIGANVGVLSGILSSSRVGAPWVVLLAGSVLCFSSYFLIWFSVTGAVPYPPLPLMCLSMLFAVQAQTFFNTPRSKTFGIMKVKNDHTFMIPITVLCFPGKFPTVVTTSSVLKKVCTCAANIIDGHMSGSGGRGTTPTIEGQIKK